MTQDDKKTYIWTAGILGVIAVLFVVAYASGMLTPAT